MKAIGSSVALGILLLSLLGFLGCSGSNDVTSAVIGEAIPVAPFAIIETSTPTYEWTPVSGVTKYRLMVHDTNQAPTTQDTSETAAIDEWYTAEEAGCASEDVLCMVTPDIEVFEENEFKVQACAYDECGLWSETLHFAFTAMDEPRLHDNGNFTVTDKKTKLMWMKIADYDGEQVWNTAVNMCEKLGYAGHNDWRLPSLTELTSISDALQCHTGIICGYPFERLHPSHAYWTHTDKPYGYLPFGSAYCRIMDDNGLCTSDKRDYCYVWCVRSGWIK